MTEDGVYLLDSGIPTARRTVETDIEDTHQKEIKRRRPYSRRILSEVERLARAVPLEQQAEFRKNLLSLVAAIKKSSGNETKKSVEHLSGEVLQDVERKLLKKWGMVTFALSLFVAVGINHRMLGASVFKYMVPQSAIVEVITVPIRLLRDPLKEKLRNYVFWFEGGAGLKRSR